MDGLEIDGGKPLHGDIIISGAKNAALPLLCLGLIADAPLILKNVPELADTISMEGLLRHLGVDVCLLYTSPSPRDGLLSRMPSSA